MLLAGGIFTEVSLGLPANSICTYALCWPPAQLIPPRYVSSSSPEMIGKVFAGQPWEEINIQIFTIIQECTFWLYLNGSKNHTVGLGNITTPNKTDIPFILDKYFQRSTKKVFH